MGSFEDWRKNAELIFVGPWFLGYFGHFGADLAVVFATAAERPPLQKITRRIEYYIAVPIIVGLKVSISSGPLKVGLHKI